MQPIIYKNSSYLLKKKKEERIGSAQHILIKCGIVTKTKKGKPTVSFQSVTVGK